MHVCREKEIEGEMVRMALGESFHDLLALIGALLGRCPLEGDRDGRRKGQRGRVDKRKR